MAGIPQLLSHRLRGPLRMEWRLSVPGMLCMIAATTGQTFSLSGIQLGPINSLPTRAVTFLLGLALFALSFLVKDGSAGTPENGSASNGPTKPETRSSSSSLIAAPSQAVRIDSEAASIAQPDVTAMPRLSGATRARDWPEPRGPSGETRVASRDSFGQTSAGIVTIAVGELERLRSEQRELQTALTNFIAYGDVNRDCQRLRGLLEKALRGERQFDDDYWDEARDRIADIRKHSADRLEDGTNEFRGNLVDATKTLEKIMLPVPTKRPDVVEGLVRRELLPSVSSMVEAAEAIETSCMNRSQKILNDIRDTVNSILGLAPSPAAPSMDSMDPSRVVSLVPTAAAAREGTSSERVAGRVASSDTGKSRSKS